MSVGYRFAIHNGPTVEARGAAAFDDDADAFRSPRMLLAI
jgi:hypothetical protein